MSERALAESIRRELAENCGKRILLRNLHNTDKFLRALSSALDDMRILAVDCTDDDFLRKSLFKYFVGESFPDMEKAFEAGWCSHATEISLCSEGAGFEIVAGLHSVKAAVRDFLLDNFSQPPGKQVLAKVFSSFAWSLPTLICFVNYTGRQGDPASALQIGTSSRMPSVLVCRRDCGNFPGAYSILESGMMSHDSVRQYLTERNSRAVPEKVLIATGGEEGLVKLYAGLYDQTGEESDNVISMLDTFLQKNAQLSLFARTAALLGMQFLPGEVSMLSGIRSGGEFVSGRKINLWRGHLAGYFSSITVREHLIKDMLPVDRDKLLKKAAYAVLEFRGENSRSYQVAGDFMARAGMNGVATEAYERAAELAVIDLRKADMYKRAASLSENRRDPLLFNAALNLFRGEFYPEALDLLKSMKNPSNSAAGVLWGLCATSGDESLREVFAASGETDIPDLVVEIIESRNLYREGKYQKAERVLQKHAIGDSLSSVVCLVELGDQLYKRGLVESSLNTMIAAGREASSLGADWLERKALFTSLKARNRLGKHGEVESKLSRLIELTLLSGNKRKLVSVYNLYANTQLLQQRFSKALNIYSSALRILAALSETRAVRIVILNNMGVAQLRLFRTEESLKTLMRLVRISVSSGNLSQACIAYGNIARIFIHLWKTDAAEDCLETMIEFAGLGKIAGVAESICYISSQLAFLKNDSETSLSLINKSIQLSRESGKIRKLSMNMVKKGSMLLRLKMYREAVDTLTEAMGISRSAGSNLNTYLAEMKLTAARCFLGESQPADLLSVKYRGNPDDTQKGEQMYYHWLLTGSRQSLAAAAQLISGGLSHGLYFHSYLHMLQKIVQNIPASLADAIPLVHNYPSCD
ncbi:MAG: tetratricopeptide repeat protein [Candidatus Sabulitectum sp.]|nr:tetratricopeptide repeat protein [Candidatus Sabulitectum sp.]